jgi:hypothetical protein
MTLGAIPLDDDFVSVHFESGRNKFFQMSGASADRVNTVALLA